MASIRRTRWTAIAVGGKKVISAAMAVASISAIQYPLRSRVYGQTGDPIAGSTNPQSAGNGSIMRLAPVPMFYYPDLAAAVRYSAESSRTTHGAPECIDACRLLAGIICRALSGLAKEDVLFGEAESFRANRRSR